MLLTVKYPTPKAVMSVTLVTVMETPACLIVCEMISLTVLLWSQLDLLTLLRH